MRNIQNIYLATLATKYIKLYLYEFFFWFLWSVFYSFLSFLEGCSIIYAQCGGIGWTGATTCCSGSGTTCSYLNDYYWQCLPTGGSSSSSSSSSSESVSSTTTISSSGNGGGQAGITTRYWDCCKASCGWAGKASVTNPVETCAQDGHTSVDVNTQSVCSGGSAYMCTNQQPWNVSSTLSYGYAAAYISVRQIERFNYLENSNIYICMYVSDILFLNRVKANQIGVVHVMHWHLHQDQLLVK